MQCDQFTPSGVTDGGLGWEPSPLQLNVKTEPPFSLYIGFSIILVFSRLLFFCIFRKFFGVFSGDSRLFYGHLLRIHYDFSFF